MKHQDDSIRVKTRLLEWEDNYPFTNLILLPSNSMSNSILSFKVLSRWTPNYWFDLTRKYFVLFLQNEIREWIVEIHKSKVFSSKLFVTPPIYILVDLVRVSEVFEVVTVDLYGPFFLENKFRIWIVIFTCAEYRAVYLELVTNLTTEGFTHALKRSIGRRDRNSATYSDNGVFLGVPTIS